MTETPTPAPVVDRMAAARAARAAKQAEKKAASPTPAPVVAAAAEARPADAADAPVEPTILEKVAANQEQKRLQKIEALRKAKAAHNTEVGEPLVQVRILKKGHGQVSMGEHIGGLGELTYDHGETPSFPQSIAQALEDKGLVEIQ